MERRHTISGLVLAGLLVLAGYWALFDGRPDYRGHFLAGLGGTLILLGVLAAVSRRPIGWSAAGVTLAAIGLGAATEGTLFRLVVFDPVDFCNQSLGACLAGAGVLGRVPSVPLGAWLAAVGIVALAGGFASVFGG